MTDSAQDTTRKIGDSDAPQPDETGVLDVKESNLAEATRQRYRQLQLVSIVTAFIHAAAVFLAIYSVKEGNLYDFSVTRLLEFVPVFTTLWQLTCFAVALSAISYLILFIAFKNVLRVRQTMWMNVGLFLVAVALANDLQSLGNMMIYFSDVAHQLVHGTFPKQQLLLEAWRALSESVTETLLIANGLFSISGLILSGAIISGFGLPKWLGWTSIPICMVGLGASFMIFIGEFSLAMVMFFSTLIAFILWTIATAVAIDPFSHAPKGKTG